MAGISLASAILICNHDELLSRPRIRPLGLLQPAPQLLMLFGSTPLSLSAEMSPSMFLPWCCKSQTQLHASIRPRQQRLGLPGSYSTVLLTCSTAVFKGFGGFSNVRTIFIMVPEHCFPFSLLSCWWQRNTCLHFPVIYFNFQYGKYSLPQSQSSLRSIILRV